MNTKQDVEGFVAQKLIAVAGLSRDEKAFSSRAVKELEAKSYRIIPVNPNAETIGGKKCYPSLAALPEKVGGVLIFTPPAVTEKVVRDASSAGIDRVWIQQGAASEAALRVCREKGMKAVSGKCILMFAEPVGSLHAFHRWIMKVFGKLPK